MNLHEFQAKQLLRGSIDSHLGNRPLQSRDLYKAYMKNRHPDMLETLE